MTCSSADLSGYFPRREPFRYWMGSRINELTPTVQAKLSTLACDRPAHNVVPLAAVQVDAIFSFTFTALNSNTTKSHGTPVRAHRLHLSLGSHVRVDDPALRKLNHRYYHLHRAILRVGLGVSSNLNMPASVRSLAAHTCCLLLVRPALSHTVRRRRGCCVNSRGVRQRNLCFSGSSRHRVVSTCVWSK